MRWRAMGSRTSTPKRKADPLVALTKPSSTFMVVVFPAPLGPRNPKTSPARMLRFRSLTATFFACPEFCARNSTRKFLVSTIRSMALLRAQVGDHFPDRNARGGIEAGSRLVEEQDLRIVHHAAGYFEAASHAARERRSEGVGAVRKTDRGEQFLGTLAAQRAGDAEQARVNADIFG